MKLDWEKRINIDAIHYALLPSIQTIGNALISFFLLGEFIGYFGEMNSRGISFSRSLEWPHIKS